MKSSEGGIVAGIFSLTGFVAMLWMIYEVLGIGNIFGYSGLSNDDAESRASDSMVEAFFDPIGFLVTTFLLVTAIISFRLARTTIAKGSMIVSIIFYVLSFFRVSVVFPMLFSAFGMGGATLENIPDERVPTAEELVIGTPELALYRKSNGTRVMTTLTNATAEHWESAKISVTVHGADGAVCAEFDHTESRIGPGEQRDYVSEFLNPAYDYRKYSCVPTSATVTGLTVDVDSRSQIDEAAYGMIQRMPDFAVLNVQETTRSYADVIDVSVVGALTPESLGVIGDDLKFDVRFEIADSSGLRLDWCFKPQEISADGSFNTGKYHSPVDPDIFVTVIPVPGC